MRIIQKAIIKKGDKYLILKRSPKAVHFPLRWDFPGGKLETQEDGEVGIEREVMEETNLRVKAQEILGNYEFALDGPVLDHHFIVWQVELIGGEVKISHEHTEYKWLTKEEIEKLKVEPYIVSFFKEHD